VQQLLRLTGDRLMLLVGDKGPTSGRGIRGLFNPTVAEHGGFSMAVNLDAVKRLLEIRGHAGGLLTNRLEGLKVGCFVARPSPGTAERKWGSVEQQFPHTAFAFDTDVDCFGPEDFFTLQRAMKEEHAPKASVRGITSMVRLSCFDPDVFLKFKNRLIDRVSQPQMSELGQEDLRRDLLAVYSNYFPVHGSKDLAFELGRVFMSMKRCKLAIPMFLDSVRDHGVHHVTYYNLGLCYNFIGTTKELLSAKACFAKSLELNPGYEEAKEFLARVTKKIQSKKKETGEQQRQAPENNNVST
jgi:hypothetical protein